MVRGYQPRPGASPARGRIASSMVMAALACLGGLANGARGDMLIQGFDPALHERFYQPATESLFIGRQFDLSGIGQAASGQWATLISPDLFLTCQHDPTPVGGQVTFYTDNTRAHPVVRTVAGLTPIAGGDIMLGRLDGATTGLAAYPLPAQTTASWYTGQELWVYGQPNRLGRNVVSWAGSGLLGFAYDNPGLGPDECSLQTGDSGAPSFEVFGDRLVLVGVHYGTQPGMSIDTATAYFTSQILSQASAWGESLASAYLPIPGDVNLDGQVGLLDLSIVKADCGQPVSAWTKGDLNRDGQVSLLDYNIVRANFGRTAGGAGATAVPEPATLSLLALGALAAMRRPRGRAT